MESDNDNANDSETALAMEWPEDECRATSSFHHFEAVCALVVRGRRGAALLRRNFAANAQFLCLPRVALPQKCTEAFMLSDTRLRPFIGGIPVLFMAAGAGFFCRNSY